MSSNRRAARAWSLHRALLLTLLAMAPLTSALDATTAQTASMRVGQQGTQTEQQAAGALPSTVGTLPAQPGAAAEAAGQQQGALQRQQALLAGGQLQQAAVQVQPAVAVEAQPAALAGSTGQPQVLGSQGSAASTAGTAAAAAASMQQQAATQASGGRFPGTVDNLFLCQDKLQNSTVVEQLPQLKIEQVLDSSKPRSPQDVTLVTQLSFERLYMLEGQCDVWNGVISAAVYIALLNGKVVTVELNSNQDPRLTEIAEVEHKFKQFHQLAEAKGLCKLDLQLVSQTVESIWLSALYPVNSMRNRALANARTDAVLLLDVDFWPSAELSELMQRPAKYASLLRTLEGGAAVVLPAYETADSGDIGVEVARETVLEGKDAAVRMFRDGRIKAFHTDRYEAGHRATDYKRWMQAVRPYDIEYEEGFEPYVIIARKYVPWYDERFVGYRKNKVVHLLSLSTSGAQFMVHPRAFAVHSPHPRARTWKVTHKTGLWDQLAEIYDQAKAGMLAGSYIPVAMYSCGAHTAGPLMAQRPTLSRNVQA